MTARFFVDGFGSPEQRERWLPLLAAGRITASVAISEPGTGAHPKHLRTAAQRDGAGWRLTGEKAYVTNGPIADLYVVLAVVAVEDGRKRYSAFLVPRDTPGLALVEGAPLDFLRPSPHCGLRLDRALVPAGSVLGPPGGAYEAMALPFRDVEDAVGASGLAGVARSALRRLAARIAPERRTDAAADLGEIAALLATLDCAAAACAAAAERRDGTAGAVATPPADLVAGARLLTAHVAARLREACAAWLPEGDSRVDLALADLAASARIARGPRLARQVRLGEALFGG